MDKLRLESFLPYRLNRIGGVISREFRSVYGPDNDLTVPEWRVLATLGEFEAMGAKAIGAHSYMHKTKVSRAVRALEDRRWLQRETNSSDRREEILRLTSLGRRRYAEIIPRALRFERALLEGLGPAARELLAGLDQLEDLFDFTAAPERTSSNEQEIKLT